tara:strand:- start:3628 stop:4977 length:1350 start_codon:yes stop_codon:yes gene_type:complete
MKKWQDNKKVHNKLWGSVYDIALSESAKKKDFLQAWEEINVQELMQSSLGRDANRVPYVIDGSPKFGNLVDCLHIKIGVLFNRILSNLEFAPELIVDLGSGWGRNSLYISKFLNREYNFLSCELSDAGRECTDHLAQVYDLPIKTLPFNYYDNSSLLEYFSKNTYQRVLFFSNHSIEQIQKLEENFFTSILDLPIEQMKFVHIEPIDWQILNNPKNTDSHYNENLYSTLCDLRDARQIKINIIKPSYFGLKHTNTGSLLEWEKMNSTYKISNFFKENPVSDGDTVFSLETSLSNGPKSGAYTIQEYITMKKIRLSSPTSGDRTICGMLRNVNVLSGYQSEKKITQMIATVNNAVLKLREYKQDFDKNWWNNRKDTVLDKNNNVRSNFSPEKLKQAIELIELQDHSLYNSYRDLHNKTNDENIKKFILECVYYTHRINEKLLEYESQKAQ